MHVLLYWDWVTNVITRLIYVLRVCCVLVSGNAHLENKCSVLVSGQKT